MDVDALVQEERREYYRKWRAENKDKVSATNARYWKKRAMKRLETKEVSTNSKEGDGNVTDSNSRRGS